MRINSVWKCQGHRVAKITLNKNQVGRFILFDFKVASKAIVFKMMWCWHVARHIDQWNQTKSRNKPTNIPSTDSFFFLHKGLQDNPGKRKSFQQAVLYQLGKHSNKWTNES